jgi:AbrB family looped-hinge helix DNA binding protein
MVAAEKPAGELFTTTVSSKGQVVIPKAMRERLGLKPGDVLEVEEVDGALLLRVRRETLAEQKLRLFGPPVPLESLAARFAGRVPEHLRGLSMKEMRAQAQAEFARRWREKEARIAAQVENGIDEDGDE